MERLRLGLFCVLSGICIGSNFLVWMPPLWTWISIVPFFWLTDSCSPRTAFLRGWAAGIAAWAVGIYWAVNPAFTLTGTFSWQGPIVLLLLFTLWGLHLAVVAGLSAFIAKGKDGCPRIQGLFAFSLVLSLSSGEWFIPSLFPAVISLNQVPHLTTIQSMDLFGTAGIAVLLIGFNAALYYCLRRSYEERRLAGFRPLIVMLFIVMANEAYGHYRMAGFSDEGMDGRSMHVVVVQASVSMEDRENPANFSRNLEKYNRLTSEAISKVTADLVVWPQNSYERWIEFSRDDPEFRTPLIGGEDASKTVRREVPHPVPIVLGTGGKRIMRWEGKRRIVRRYYLSLLKGSGGDVREIAAKRFPTPFSERVPFASLFPFLNRFFPNRVPIRSGFQAPLRMKSDILLGAFICYDIVIGRSPRDLAAEGAELLVALTSDQWSNARDSYEISLRFAVVRAIENRRSLIRASTSGISVIVSPSGQTLKRLDIDQAGWVDAAVPLLSGTSLANRLGAVPYWVLLVILGGLALRRCLFEFPAKEHS